MPGGVLKKASRLLRARKFDAAIRLLEPVVFQYRESFDYYYLLGRACLHRGDWRGAESYIERAVALDAAHTGARLGLTFLMLRAGRKEQALRSWLQILDDEPRNRKARHGLEIVRKGYDLSEDSRRITRLLPSLPARRGPWIVALALGIVVGGAVALALNPSVVLTVSEAVRPTRITRELPPFDLPSTPLITGADAVYVLSEWEVRSTFERARRLFAAYQDNEACIELNRLLLSNAEEGVKARALMLKGYVQQQDFTTLKHSASYEQVTAEPGLYAGCYVRWTGRVANLSVGDDTIVFELLVGYEKGTELKGLVPASMSFASSIKSGDNVEVVGRVGVIDEKTVGLKVVSVRRIVAK